MQMTAFYYFLLIIAIGLEDGMQGEIWDITELLLFRTLMKFCSSKSALVCSYTANPVECLSDEAMTQ